MTIEGQAMRIQAWTPDFTPEEETPIVPIWVSIPGLPWHCYNKVFLKTILESIGKVLFLDSPTSQRNRGSTTRVKVQVDLTKDRPSHVWLGFKDANPNKGRWLKVDYESIPSYCFYCRHQGHRDEECTIKRRDDETRKKKELEEVKNSKETGAGKSHEQGKSTREENSKGSNQQPKSQQGGTGQASDMNQTKDQIINQQQRNSTQWQTEQRQQGETNEDQWQTQKKKHQKQQEHVNSKAVWRPVTPPMQASNGNSQQEQKTSGINVLPTQNFFSHLEMQEIQDIHQTGRQIPKETIANSINQNANLQKIEKNSKKIPGIDLSLPSPKTPILINVKTGHTVEVCGGMDGGSKEIPINLQEGVTKGGSLPHVMHEGLDDHRIDYRDPKDTNNSVKQQVQPLQQQLHNRDSSKHFTKEKTVQQQSQKKDETDLEEKSGNMTAENTSKRRNKPSKQKRDAEKRRQSKQQDKVNENVKEMGEETCNKFVMVDDNHGLDIPPLQIQYMTPSTAEQQYKQRNRNQEVQQPMEDEYAVINSEDEMMEDEHLLDDSDDNDETSEALIRAFSPSKDQTIEKEKQQVTQNQCLSPRSFQQDKFHFTKQDANTVTSGRPNTRLFSSKSSQ